LPDDKKHLTNEHSPLSDRISESEVEEENNDKNKSGQSSSPLADING